jgi:hypothetical protein
MRHLQQHIAERPAPQTAARTAAPTPVLRYRNGRPITRRRYDHLWARIGRHLPWVATQQISTHWLRHTTLTWVEPASATASPAPTPATPTAAATTPAPPPPTSAPACPRSPPPSPHSPTNPTRSHDNQRHEPCRGPLRTGCGRIADGRHRRPSPDPSTDHHRGLGHRHRGDDLRRDQRHRPPHRSRRLAARRVAAVRHDRLAMSVSSASIPTSGCCASSRCGTNCRG